MKSCLDYRAITRCHWSRHPPNIRAIFSANFHFFERRNFLRAGFNWGRLLLFSSRAGYLHAQGVTSLDNNNQLIILRGVNLGSWPPAGVLHDGQSQPALIMQTLARALVIPSNNSSRAIIQPGDRNMFSNWGLPEITTWLRFHIPNFTMNLLTSIILLGSVITAFSAGLAFKGFCAIHVYRSR